MENANLGDYLLWEGKPAKIVATCDRRMVIIEMLESSLCPHCNGDLGKEQYHVVVASPQFQNGAMPLQTIK